MAILLGGLGLVSVVVYDEFYSGVGALSEGIPSFTPGQSIRSVVIAVSVAAIIGGLMRNRRPHSVFSADDRGRIERLGVWTTLLLSAVFLIVFLVLPARFSTLSLEDGPIEWGSALLLLGAGAVMAIAWWRGRTSPLVSAFTRLSLLGFSILFVVMAMEEISWMQRVLGIETPGVWAGNGQQEMNLHNFATNRVENAYYFGTFLFLVGLPFVRSLYPRLADERYLGILAPRPFIGLIGAVACAYNFDMWNISFTQMAFFGSAGILLVFAKLSRSDPTRYTAASTLVLLVVTQLAFLVNGAGTFERVWEVTEYKEFLIPLALLAYGVDVLSQVKPGARFEGRSREGVLESMR